MLIRAGSEIKDLNVIRIAILPDPEDPQGINLEMFYCPRCQGRLLMYSGIIHSISNIDSPRLTRNMTIILCKNKRRDLESLRNPSGICGRLYYFQID